MKRTLLWTGVVILIVVVSVGGYLWVTMGQPLYQPGMVAQGKGLSAALQPPVQKEAGSFWNVEKGIKLFHFNQGKGKRHVLFVHGGPGIPPTEPMMGLAKLESQYTFHFYHQRGCGKSTRPVQAFSSSNFYSNMVALNRKLGLAAQIADIERIRRILKQDKLFLVGHSFGAFLAAMYAAEFPQRVRGLILLAPADVLVFPVPGGDLFKTIRKALPASKVSAYNAFLKKYFAFGSIFKHTEKQLSALNQTFGDFYRIAAKSKGFDVPKVKASDVGGWMVQAMYFGMGREHDFRPALSKVNAFTCIIHGAKDLQGENAGRRYVAAFKEIGVRFAVMKEAGHFMWLDKPVTFGKLMKVLLERPKW
ncbi:MAG: alpha/beta hydrolase [Deltaproteobacteria bacterium]|nr:MAG: alpha/beta hydrolase [Deltaproteobacteria bacterium]